MNFRVGIGYDVHRLVTGRKCIIGGVEFNHPKGLFGHSDADVLLHAICDAMLGAANLGDIGRLFPDTDVQFKDAGSKELLKKCYQRVKDKGYQINNLDTIVVCQKPKIAEKIDEMTTVIAGLLETNKDNVSIKATTEEKMGFTGKGEGIKAWAYVSIIPQCGIDS